MRRDPEAADAEGRVLLVLEGGEGLFVGEEVRPRFIGVFDLEQPRGEAGCFDEVLGVAVVLAESVVGDEA